MEIHPPPFSHYHLLDSAFFFFNFLFFSLLILMNFNSEKKERTKYIAIFRAFLKLFFDNQHS